MMGRARQVVDRLDEASAALEEARELCEEFGEEDSAHDCSMAMGIIEEVAAVIQGHAEGEDGADHKDKEG